MFKNRSLRTALVLLATLMMGLFAVSRWPSPAQAADPPADLQVDVSEPPDVIVYPPDTPHPTPQPGDYVRYAVDVNNLGSGAASSVTVRVDLPESLQFAQFVGDTACTYAAGVISCDVGDVPAGPAEVFLVVFEGTIAPQASSLDVAATVSTSSVDSDPSNNTDTSHLSFDASADLSATVQLDGDPDQPIAPGDSFSVWLVVTNNGPAPAYNIETKISWPESVSFSYFDGRCGINLEERNVRCSGSGPFNPGQMWVIPVKLTLNADAAGEVTLTGLGTAGTVDPDPSNNEASFTFTAAPAADLSVAMTADSSSGPRGRKIAWTIDVVNNGPSVAADVVVTDRLPAGISPVSLPAGCSAKNQVVTCPRPDLAVGDRTSLQIVGRVTGHVSTTTFTNVATVASSTADPTTPNTASSTVTRG